MLVWVVEVSACDAEYCEFTMIKRLVIGMGYRIVEVVSSCNGVSYSILYVGLLECGACAGTGGVCVWMVSGVASIYWEPVKE